MNKKVIVKISVFVLILLSIAFITNVSADFVDQIKPDMGTGIAKTTQSVAKTIIAYISVTAIGIAIVMLIYLAIKYMISAPEARAEYKQTLLKYGIGLIIILTASTLANIIADLASNLTSKI